MSALDPQSTVKERGLPNPRFYAVVHLAGPMLGLVQKCSRCGYVLHDYRNAGVLLNPDGTTPRLGHWEGYVRAEGIIGERAGYYAAVDEPDAPLCTETIQ